MSFYLPDLVGFAFRSLVVLHGAKIAVGAGVER
jgi:hypothetical protein